MHKCDTCSKYPCDLLIIVKQLLVTVDTSAIDRQLRTTNRTGGMKLEISECPDWEEGGELSADE